MKKLTRLSALIAVILILDAFTYKMPTSSFEGVIMYNISYDGTPGSPVHQLVPNSNLTIYLKNGNTCLESSLSNTNTITIYLGTNNVPTTLMDAMGGHYQLIQDSATTASYSITFPITYLSGTKTIAGYLCSEAQVTLTDNNGNSYTSDIYYTTLLPYNTNQGQFRGLNGFPLSFTMKGNGQCFTWTAQSVTSQSVADSVFQVPSYYKQMTTQQMSQDMATNMGASH
jgi:GLPGLI family protein